jgi:zinc transport system substrate-binding protein
MAFALGLLLVACSSNGNRADGRLRVIAAFYPLAEAASRIGGGAVEVQNLTPPGVEPHDMELAPQQIADIQSSDVVLYLGQGFAPAIESAIADADGITLDLLAEVPLRPGAGEQEGGRDPHVWLDPVLYREISERIIEALSEADPANSATYRANGADFADELTELDEQFRRGLTGCERDLIVTSHAAFGYLTDRYGLTQESIAGVDPDAEPSAERLAELAELVRDSGVTTIFTEELVSPAVAQSLADEVGVTTATLDPLESLTEAQIESGEDYVSVMGRNLERLREALGCD